MSVKRRWKTERPESVLFERSEFTDDSVVFHRSSEASAALIFWLLLDQAKSNDLLNLASVEETHRTAGLLCLCLVMGNHYYGASVFLVQFMKYLHNLDTHL